MRNTASVVRQPRGIVKINDEVMRGWISWDVDNNTFYEADTFRVVFALSDLPSTRSADWWAAQTTIYAEVLGGFPKNPDQYDEKELTSWIYGRVDSVEMDPTSRTITIDGRDLTALMIDTKTTEKWVNLTASQIAISIAKRHSLIPVVTTTTRKTGSYYQIDYARLTDAQSEWDLLTYLAHDEGYLVYVKGKELHFEPVKEVSAGSVVVVDHKAELQKEIADVNAAWAAEIKKSKTLLASATEDGNKMDAANAAGNTALAEQYRVSGISKCKESDAIVANAQNLYQGRLRALEARLNEPPEVTDAGGAYLLQIDPPRGEIGYYQFNGQSIRFSRNLTVARGVVVTVRSWNNKQKKGFTVTYPKSKAKGVTAGNATTDSQNYFFTRPDLTPEKALQIAQAKHREITQHEMKLYATLPGDDSPLVTDVIKVIGTGTAFDQVYFPDSISRSMSIETGYSMTISAKNSSPENQTVI